MESILIGILVMVALAIISLVLLQHGKGSDMGAAFGSGTSNTVFGSQGSTSFLAKLTFSLVLVFFVICIILTGIASRAAKGDVKIIVPQNNIPIPAAQHDKVQRAHPVMPGNNTVPIIPVTPKKQAKK